jgi:hypothetical protein
MQSAQDAHGPWATRIRVAHGDAWYAEGRWRRPLGGDAAELPGVRLMASGLPHAQWNNGDVDDPALVEIDTVRHWYASRGMPWGLRVPAGAPWPYGRFLFRKRLMGLAPNAFRPPAGVPGLRIHPASPADLDAVLALDALAFRSDIATERTWVQPHLAWPAAELAVAHLRGTAVGTGYAVRTEGRAGPAVYLAGLAVRPGREAPAVTAEIVAWLVSRGFAAGADLAHLHPDDDAAALDYRELGFAEVPGFDVYVDV